MDLQKRFKKTLQRYDTGQALIVAVSGGADSVCLLWLMKNLGERLTVVHINHGLRGTESKKDEALVKKLCEKWGLELFVKSAKIKKGSGLESNARHARHKALASIALKKQASLVFLAHHQGDRAETLLMNLSRGAGLRGAGALRELAPFPGQPTLALCRPLLNEESADLRKALKSAGVKWREDASNLDRKLARNRVRHEVLPSLEKAWPGSSARLADFSRRAEEAADWIEARAQIAFEWSLGANGSLDLRKFGRDPYLDRQVLLAWLRQAVGAGADEASLRRLEAGIERGRGLVDLGRGKTAEIRRGRLYFR